jgi:hypothetical protein
VAGLTQTVPALSERELDGRGELTDVTLQQDMDSSRTVTSRRRYDEQLDAVRGLSVA